MLRKHLNGGDKKVFPSMAQKYFNGSDAASELKAMLQRSLKIAVSSTQESVILARWLMGVTLGLAVADESNEHAWSLALHI